MPKSLAERRRLASHPYAKGFQPPTAKQQLAAIGYKNSNRIPKYLEPTKSFFDPIPQPTDEDDWLAQYCEEGQTFTEFMQECPWLSRRKVKYSKASFNKNGSSLMKKYPDGKIYLVGLGKFDGENSPSMDNLVKYAEAFFQIPIAILPGIKLDISNGVVYLEEDKKENVTNKPGSRKSFRSKRHRLNARFDAETGKMQLNVDTILQHLRVSIPPDALCLVALTMHDLFADKTDLFVAGMASGNNRVAVFSFYRYNPSLTFSIENWYEENRKKVDEKEAMKLILQRSCKLLVHEIAHILGVDHCIYFSCCMNGSGHLEEDYRQSMHLCPVDLNKLHVLCDFDIEERYENLLKFFTEHGLTDEETWVRRRLEFIRAKDS